MAIFQDADVQPHAVKAAHAALALLAATAALNRENHQQPLAIHLGINSGLALVGSTRFEALRGPRWTFTASGPVTNLDAGFVLTPIGPRVLKNLEAVDVYRLVRAK